MWSRTVREMKMPLGSANASNRAANINAVAEDVVLFNDYVADIDPDAEPDPTLFGNVRLTVDHPALDLDRTSHRTQNTRKFREHAVAGILDDAAAMLGDLRINQLEEMRLQPFVSAFLIGTHQS